MPAAISVYDPRVFLAKPRGGIANEVMVCRDKPVRTGLFFVTYGSIKCERADIPAVSPAVAWQRAY